MTLMLQIIITLICLAPVLPCLRPPRKGLHNLSTAQAAHDFYKTQLDALAREVAHERIDGMQVQHARAEIARRILSIGTARDLPQPCASLRWVVAILALLAVTSSGLYLISGAPGYGPHPAALQRHAENPEIAALVEKLEQRVQALTPQDPDFVRGHLLLAAVHERQGDVAQAVTAYEAALSAKFDPLLAVHIADLKAQIAHHVTKECLLLYRKALAEAPKDAFWRLEVEKRIAVGEQDTQEVAP